MKKGVIIGIVVFMGVSPLMAQQERKFIREGNGLFHAQDFEKSEVEYRKALDKEEASYAAAFNLADAMYKQKKFDEALQQFTSLSKDQTDKERLGELFHNIGNTFLSQQKLDESIEAYKESLRNRPNSQETKYNLEFARKMKQEQENQDDKDQDNKDNKDNKDDQNKDEQNKDQDSKDEQNKDEQNKDQQDKDEQNKDQQDKNEQDKDQQGQDQDQQQESLKISPEEAKRLLDMLGEGEKKTQEKVQKDKMEALKAKRMKIEKNW